MQLEEALGALRDVDVASLCPTELGDLVVCLRRAAARLEAEIARFVHAAERAEVWRQRGATSMEAWLADATSSTFRTARDQVRLADVLAMAPVLTDRLRDGGLSIDNARLIGAVVGHDAFDDHVDTVLELASGSPRQTRQGLDHWLALVDPAGEAERDAELAERECLRFTPDGRGMHDVTGKLTDHSVAAVQAALGHLAGAAYDDHTGRSPSKRTADALVQLCRAHAAGEITGGRERPKLLVTAPVETLDRGATTRGTVAGSDITLSGEQVRAMLCDADVHRVVTRGRSAILDFGTATRLVSDSQFLALTVRDGGCRWPGCDRPPQWCDAHHIDEVARDDGPTDLDNLVLLCSTHHHLVHQRRWSLHGDAHTLHVRTPTGDQLDAPPRGTIRRPRQLALAP